MKITVEFSSIQDMLFQMPKFGQLMAGDAPAEERMAAAIEDDPTPLIMKITPKDGIPFTEEEKDAIRSVISSFIDTARIEKIEKIREEITAQAAGIAASEVPAEKPKKNPPKEEEQAESKPDEAPEVSQTSARAALNGLVKSRGNAAVKLVFKTLGVSNFGDLTEADQYAKAVAEADKVSQMSDDEYAAALKEAGIKGGKK